MNARAFGAGSFHLVPATPAVIGRAWLDGAASDPPTLELLLSNGAYLKIGWDLDYQHKLLWWAQDVSADFAPCTAESACLDPLVLDALVEEVYRAVLHDEAERLAGCCS